MNERLIAEILKAINESNIGDNGEIAIGIRVTERDPLQDLMDKTDLLETKKQEYLNEVYLESACTNRPPEEAVQSLPEKDRLMLQAIKDAGYVIVETPSTLVIEKVQE